ncbi:MAG: rod shape-determining protein MreD [Candidatus Omnitrophota bacterium]
MRLYRTRSRTKNYRICNCNPQIVRWLKLIGIILSCQIIEATILGNFRFFAVLPNLSLLIILYFSLFLDLKEALILNAITGLIKDSLSGTIFGLNLFLFIIYTLTIWFLRKQLYKEDFSIQVVIVCITAFINAIIFASLYKLFITVVILETLYTAILMLPVFKILRKCALK